MAVVLLSGDLMGASRIEGAARLSGVEFRMIGSVDAVIDCCAAQRVSLVMVDLATAGLDVSSLVERLKSSSEHGPAIVAFGPHVHEAALDAAQEAGCDQVLSRGQFMSQAGAIIARYQAGRQS
jgi:DNA-binding NtrC family response regulator